MELGSCSQWHNRKKTHWHGLLRLLHLVRGHDWNVPSLRICLDTHIAAIGNISGDS